MAEPAPPITQIEPCPACTHGNERPWLFCEQCGEARARMSRWRVMANLTITFSCLLAASYFRIFFPQNDAGETWLWPLYSLYFFYLFQFTLALAHGQWRLRTRLASWMLVTFVLSIAGFTNLYMHGWGTFFLDLIDIIPLSKEYPLIFWPALAAILVAVLGPVYARWVRLYGWVMSYRLMILIGIAVCGAVLAALRIMDYIHVNKLMGEEQAFLKRFMIDAAPRYNSLFVFLGITLIRIFIFEIVVYSAVHGYAKVARAVRVSAKAKATAGEGGFARSLTAISRAVMRLVQTVENMTKYLISTSRDLVRDVTKVTLAIFREIIIPVIAMAGIALLLYRLMLLSDQYIVEGHIEAVFSIMASLLLVLLSAVIFMWCKSHVRWRRIVAFYGQMIGWLLPNLLLFFLLLSLTLAASSYALNRFEDEDWAGTALTFRVGWLTKIDAGILLALVAFVIVRKSRQLRVEEAEAIEAGLPLPPKDKIPFRQRVKKLFHRRKKTPKPQETAEEKEKKRLRLMPESVRRQVTRLQNTEVSRAIHQKMEDLHLRAKGKPGAVNDLARIRDEAAEQERKLAALETRRGSVSDDLFNKLKREYDIEFRRLAAQRDDLQAEVDQLYLRQFVKVEEARVKLATARQRRTEVEQLRAEGIIDAAKFAELAAEADKDIETQRLLLEGCEQVLGWLAEEASPARTAPAPPPQAAEPEAK